MTAGPLNFWRRSTTALSTQNQPDAGGPVFDFGDWSGEGVTGLGSLWAKTQFVVLASFCIEARYHSFNSPAICSLISDSSSQSSRSCSSVASNNSMSRLASIAARTCSIK